MENLSPLLVPFPRRSRKKARKYVAEPDSLSCVDGSRCSTLKSLASKSEATTQSVDGRDSIEVDRSKAREYEEALRRRDFRVVLWMITNGDVPVEYETRTGETALLAAVSTKNFDALGILMKSGVSINDSNRKGYTPLMKALAAAVPLTRAQGLRCKPPMKRTLSAHTSAQPANNNIDEGGLSATNDSSKSPVSTNEFDNGIVERVLTYRPNLLRKDGSGKTAFDWAKRTGNTQALRWLETMQKEKTLRHQSLANRQARIAECWDLMERHEGYIQRIETLIAPQFFDEDELVTFLKTTTISAQEFADALRDIESEHDADNSSTPSFKTQFFVDVENREGWTPLSKCAATGYVKAVQELLMLGANMQYETRLRHTAMTWACYCGHEAVCLYLLRSGVDVNQKTQEGKTALIHAVTNSQVKIVYHLLIALRDQSFPVQAIDSFSSELDPRTLLQLKSRYHEQVAEGEQPLPVEWHEVFLKIMRWKDKTGKDILEHAQRATELAILSDKGEMGRGGDSRVARANQVLQQVKIAIKEAEDHLAYVQKHEMRTRLTKCRHDGCSFMAAKDVLPTHEHHHCLKRTITCELCNASVIFEDRTEHDEQRCPLRRVVCVNLQFGCQERMLFQEQENHAAQHCRKRSVQCRRLCGATLRFDELDHHETSQCPSRTVTCEFGCQQSFAAKHAKQHRRKDCPKRLVLCTGETGAAGGCGAQVKVEDMAFHVSTLCEMRRFPCKWAVYGCDEVIGGVAAARHNHETVECLFRPVPCRNGCELSGQFLACFEDEHYRWQCMEEKKLCPNGCSAGSTSSEALQLPAHLILVHDLVDAGDCPKRKAHCLLDLCGKHIRLFDIDQEGPSTMMSADSRMGRLEGRTICLKALKDRVHRSAQFLLWLQGQGRLGQPSALKTGGCDSEGAIDSSDLFQKPATQAFLVDWLQGLHDTMQSELEQLEATKGSRSCICRVLTYDLSKAKHLVEFPDGHSEWLKLDLREYDVLVPEDVASASTSVEGFRCGLLEAQICVAHAEKKCLLRLVPCPLKCGQRLPAQTVNTHLARRCSMRNSACRLGCGEIMAIMLLAEHEEERCERRSVFCDYCQVSLRLQELSTHLEKQCQQLPRSCRLGCTAKVIWADIAQHESSECPKRLIQCAICEKDIWFCEREEHERDECPLRVYGECDAGCGQVLKHNEIAHHLLFSCSQRLVNCAHCDERMPFASLKQHKALLCPQRFVRCRKGCGMLLKEANADLHEDGECSKRLLFCKNQCGLQIPCFRMEEHLQSQCSMRVIECPTGCREWIFAYLFEDHWKRCRQRIVPCGIGGKLCARPIRVWFAARKLVRCALHGENALLWALKCQDLDLVTYFLQSVDAADAVNEEFANGFAPLLLAASLGNVELVQLLLRFGADVNLETSRGRTPLAEACMAQEPAIVKFLIDNRASVSHTNRQGTNLLQMARTFAAASAPPLASPPVLTSTPTTTTSLEVTTATPATTGTSLVIARSSESKWPEIIRMLEERAALEKEQRDLFVAIACSDYEHVAQFLKHTIKAPLQSQNAANQAEALNQCVQTKTEAAAAAHAELDEAVRLFNECIADTEAKSVRATHMSAQMEDSSRHLQRVEKAIEASEADSNALEADMLALVREITAQDIAKMLDAHVPPDTSLVVMKALSLLCGVVPRGRRNATEYTDVEWWKTAQALLMDRSLLRKLRGYRKQVITPDVMSKVRRECLKTQAFAASTEAFAELMTAAVPIDRSASGVVAGRRSSTKIPSPDRLRGDIVHILAAWVKGVEIEYKSRAERQVLGERKRKLAEALELAQSSLQQARFEAQVAARSLPARQEEVEAVRTQSDAAEKDLAVAKKRLNVYRLLNFAALSGHTPLTFACAVGNDAMVHMLLSHGANSGHHYEEQSLCASFIQVLVRDYQFRKRFEWQRRAQAKRGGSGVVKTRSDEVIEALVRDVAHTFIVGHYKRKLAHFRQTHRVALHEAVFNGFPEIAAILLAHEARVQQSTHVLPERIFPGAPLETDGLVSKEAIATAKRAGGWKLQPLVKKTKREVAQHIGQDGTQEIEGGESEENGQSKKAEWSFGEPMTLADTLHHAMEHYDSRLFRASKGWEPPSITFYSATAEFVNGVLEKMEAAIQQQQKELAARKNVVRKTAELRAKHASLEAAIIGRDFHAISRLLDDGAFADYETSGDGLSALMVACIEEVYVTNDDKKDVLAVEFLLDRAVNHPFVNFESSRGRTALATAAFHGTAKCAQVLLERGASVNLASRLDGRTPLMVAAGNGKEAFVRFLLAHPQLDVFQQDLSGKTALVHARSGGFTEITRLLGAAMGGSRVCGRVISVISGLYGVCKWGCGFMAPTEAHAVQEAQALKPTDPLDEHERLECTKRRVDCPNGCGAVELWAEELNEHVDHLCPLRLVACSNQKCSVRFPFQRREIHLHEECDYRIVTCECGEAMTHQRHVIHAEAQCPMRFVPCPLQCKVRPELKGANVTEGDGVDEENLVEEDDIDSGKAGVVILRLRWQDVKAHVTGDCPNRSVRCRNGCTAHDLLQKDREHHERNLCLLRRVDCRWGCDETVLARTQAMHEQEECELRQTRCSNRCGRTDVPVFEMEEHIAAVCARRLTPCSLGCGRRVPLHTMDTHVSRECRKRIVQCDLCQLELLEEERTLHQSSQCAQRLTVCGLCGQTNLAQAQLAQHRSETCRMRQVACKYGCFVKLLLAHEKERHEMWECSFRPIWCPLGCGEVFVSNTLKRHQRVCTMRFVACANGCGEELREKDRAEHERDYCSLRSAQTYGALSRHSSKTT